MRVVDTWQHRKTVYSVVMVKLTGFHSLRLTTVWPFDAFMLTSESGVSLPVVPLLIPLSD